jgi:hypothetical protein
MNSAVTSGAKGEQVFLSIVSLLPSGLDVVDLKVYGGSALLAAPFIALQDPLVQLAVDLSFQSESGPLER